ncbi:hypothetical protein D3C79_831860 [compost metagenome]
MMPMSLKPNDMPKHADRKAKDKTEENKSADYRKRKARSLLNGLFLKVVGERGLRASAMLALRAVAQATWSRCARLEPPSEVISRVLRSPLTGQR